MSRPPITLVPALMRARVETGVVAALAVTYLMVHLSAGEVSWSAVGLAVVADGAILLLWRRGRRTPAPTPDVIPAGSRIRSGWSAIVEAAAYPLLLGALPVVSRSLTTQGVVDDAFPWGGTPLFAATFFATVALVGYDRVRRLRRTEIAAGRTLLVGGPGSNGTRRPWNSNAALYVEVAAPAARSFVS